MNVSGGAASGASTSTLTLMEVLSDVFQNLRIIKISHARGEIAQTVVKVAAISMQAELKKYVVPALSQDDQSLAIKVEVLEDVLNQMARGVPVSQVDFSAPILSSLIDSDQLSELEVTLLRARINRLITGHNALPPGLASTIGTSAEQTLMMLFYIFDLETNCTFSYIYQPQTTLNLIEHLQAAAEENNLPVPASIILTSINQQSFNRLNTSEIYLAQLSPEGDERSNRIIFHNGMNWYMSRLSGKHPIQLTRHGISTVEAQDFFAEHANSKSWGAGADEYHLKLLPIDKVLVQALGERVLTIRAADADHPEHFEYDLE